MSGSLLRSRKLLVGEDVLIPLRSEFSICLCVLAEVLERPFARTLHDLMREPSEVEELAVGVADRLGDLARPDVLPDQQHGRRAGLEFLTGREQVLLAEEPAD